MGFTEALSLPQSVLDELGLEPIDFTTLMMADGSPIRTPLYECSVVWADELRTVSVNRVESTPLVGMALIWGHLLTVEAMRFGDVSLTPLAALSPPLRVATGVLARRPFPPLRAWRPPPPVAIALRDCDAPATLWYNRLVAARRETSVMPRVAYTTNEIGERGEGIYQRDIRDKVEADHFGRFLVLDIESGEYEIADDHLSASHRAHGKHPDGVFYAVHIGYSGMARFGGGWGDLVRQ